MPAADLVAFFGSDGGEFDVGARGVGFDAVGVPEVVAQVEFAEPEGDLEFGGVGIGGSMEDYAGHWTRYPLLVGRVMLVVVMGVQVEFF